MCVCVCVRARVRVCVCVRVCAGARACRSVDAIITQASADKCTCLPENIAPINPQLIWILPLKFWEQLQD